MNDTVCVSSSNIEFSNDLDSEMMLSSQPKRFVSVVLLNFNMINGFSLNNYVILVVILVLNFRKCRTFKTPLQDSDMQSLSRTKFSDEMNKKIAWAKRMFTDWRNFRSSNPKLESFVCDLDNVKNITPDNLNAALCRFITEVKKVDGSDYPGKTLYDIIICIQFYLETQGF